MNDGKQLDQLRRFVEKSKADAIKDYNGATWDMSRIVYDSDIITRREVDDLLKGWFQHAEVAEYYAAFVHQQLQAGDSSKGLG